MVFFFFSIFCFLLFEIMSKENKCSLLQLNKGTGSNLTNTKKKKKKTNHYIGMMIRVISME